MTYTIEYTYGRARWEQGAYADLDMARLNARLQNCAVRIRCIQTGQYVNDLTYGAPAR